MDFDWDDANVDHIGRHGVTPEEVEEALLDTRRIGIPVFRVKSERRRGTIVATWEGRLLFVVYTRRFRAVRVVTARDATHDERQRYRR